MGAVNKDEATGCEQQIGRYRVDRDAVCCLDYGFAAVQVRVAQYNTNPFVFFVVRGDMLFRGIRVFGVHAFMAKSALRL